MNIILFGPPGAGKGTQAKNLEKKLNNFQISTGDMLRDEIKKESEIGKKIINYMNEGKFVDDEIVNKLMKNVIFDPQKKNKLIFDGYPRTLEQAKNFLSDNRYSWNSGIFVFSAKTIIEELKKLAPEIYHPCKSAIKNATRDLFFQRIDEKAMAN